MSAVASAVASCWHRIAAEHSISEARNLASVIDKDRTPPPSRRTTNGPNWNPFTFRLFSSKPDCISFKSITVLATLSYNCVFVFLGPYMPLWLLGVSMVKLGKGQAILGGKGDTGYHTKIYSMTCSNRECYISLMNQRLSIPRYSFVAIPIPDETSGCITNGNCYQKHFTSRPW